MLKGTWTTAILTTAVAGTAGIGAAPALAQPIQITACNYQIHQPGEYVVANDLIGCSGEAIQVNASGVSLDLNGRTISGDLGTTGRSFGITEATRGQGGSQNDLKVIGNGATLTGFTGALALSGRDITVTGLTIRNSTGGREASGYYPEGPDGIVLYGNSRDVVITDVAISDDDGDAGGIDIHKGANVRIEGVTITGAAVGVAVGSGVRGVKIIKSTFGDGTTTGSPLDNACDLQIEHANSTTLSGNHPGDGEPDLTSC